MSRLVALYVMLSCLAVSHVHALPEDLEGGVLITHAPSGIQYSPGMDLCDPWTTHGIGGCEEQINSMPAGTDPATQTLFYVVAAWEEDKQFCGATFGIGSAFGGHFYFTDYGACLSDAWTYATPSWPGPGEGVTVVSTQNGWEGNWLPVYAFLGYAYEEDEIPLDINPEHDFGGTFNCAYPAVTWDAACLGVMGVGTEGEDCCPVPAVHKACCEEDGSCQVLTEYGCELIGGVFHPEWDDCVVAECPQPPGVGACCFDPYGPCQVVTEDECLDMEGEYMGDDTVCEPNPCTALPRVCCYECYCELLGAAECEAMMGLWMPEFDTCDPWPCGWPDTAVCCLDDGSCQIRSWESCQLIEGWWRADICECDPNPCPDYRSVCCLENGACLLLRYQSQCEDVSGTWHADWSSCDPNPCPVSGIGEQDGPWAAHGWSDTDRLQVTPAGGASRRVEVYYYLPHEQPVTIAVFDASGRLVRRLLTGVAAGPGVHHLTWNGEDDGGRGCSSGVYFIQLSSEDHLEVERAVFMQ